VQPAPESVKKSNDLAKFEQSMTDGWDDSLLANPHAVTDKRRRVRQMFAAIAPSYDLNNRLHSLWMDQSWRRKAVRLAKIQPGDRVVDVACGTGDLTLAFVEELIRAAKGTERGGWSVPAERLPPPVIGIDFTFEMLPLAQAKTDLVHYFGTDEVENVISLWDGWRRPIVWLNGDAQNLPLEDACCDVASIAFGIRNVVDPLAAAKEFFRILRPGGRAIILEFSSPTNPVFRSLYNFYFKRILPRTATWISGDKTGAYKYLPQSVGTFIGRQTMVEMLAKAGFVNIEQHPMTFGICVCYRGFKR
jgi:demethylmenaquinone methyltransferase/2-methoxy-6-polyprenyl-1,4-benzoquinol methylase